MGIKMKFRINMRIIITLAVGLNLVLLAPLSADAIRLSGGQIMDGQIMDESDNSIVIKTPQGVFTIDKKDIIEREDAKTGKVIARPPVKSMKFRTILWKSFIPAYSPLYETPGHPEYGLPFSMLNLFYFIKFAQYQFGATRPAFFSSPTSTLNDDTMNAFGFIKGLTEAPAIGFSQGIPTLYSSLAYISIVKEYYNLQKDYKVGSVVMKEDIYLKRRKRYLAGYVTTSLISAAVSYYLLKPGSASGRKIAFYMAPNEDNGGSVGVVTTF